VRFQNGSNKVAIELHVVQFWSEIILVISNRTRAARSFDFEITRMISDQIALHSIQLPLYSHRWHTKIFDLSSWKYSSKLRWVVIYYNIYFSQLSYFVSNRSDERLCEDLGRDKPQISMALSIDFSTRIVNKQPLPILLNFGSSFSPRGCNSIKSVIDNIR